MGRSRKAGEEGSADQNQGQPKQHPEVNKDEIKRVKAESSKQVEQTKSKRKQGD